MPKKLFIITNRKTKNKNKDKWNKPDKILKCVDINLTDSIGNFISEKTLNKLLDDINNNSFYDLNTLIPKMDKTKETIIFIHGYNSSFIKSAIGVIKLFKNLNTYSGVDDYNPNIIIFSWPSAGKLGDFTGKAYKDDRINAVKSSSKLTEIFTELLKIFKLNIIAHSLGNFLLRFTIQEIIKSNVSIKFNKFISFAADEDYDSLDNPNKLAPLAKTCNEIAVYYNFDDWSLNFGMLYPDKYDLDGKKMKRLGINGTQSPHYSDNVKTCNIITRPSQQRPELNPKVITGDILSNFDHSYFISNSPAMKEDIYNVLTGKKHKDKIDIHNDFINWNIF